MIEFITKKEVHRADESGPRLLLQVLMHDFDELFGSQFRASDRG
jgi:hypothetical protein